MPLQHVYLIAKHPHSEGTNCPAAYGTGTESYTVVGRLVDDHSALSAGVSESEAAVAVPLAVLAAALAGHGVDDAGRVDVEVGIDSDVVLHEDGDREREALVIDNGAIELRLPLAATTVSGRLAIVDKLLTALSEWRVAISENAEASAR